MISLALWRHGGMALMTDVLEWKDADFLRRTGRRDEEGGVALYVNDQLECMELCLAMDEELTESLWVRITGRADLYRQTGAASRSQALVLMGDFNHPDICWRDNAAERKQSRRFLECLDDNFLLQVTEKPTRRGAMLDLVLTNKEGLVGNVKLKGSLGCSDHEMVEFKILRAARRACSNSLPWTSGEQALASSGICLVEYHGRKPWRKEGPKTAG
ncbi:hypothetical protein GRJ2_000823900 [Grus japonensis]|uniref:Endonuclease/exonuclease/phosphatase domain-containing protein n=1 Tax=Grus japonensis TaxID=30415 RepID=A0ABC9WE89_GRUJA